MKPSDKILKWIGIIGCIAGAFLLISGILFSNLRYDIAAGVMILYGSYKSIKEAKKNTTPKSDKTPER